MNNLNLVGKDLKEGEMYYHDTGSMKWLIAAKISNDSQIRGFYGLYVGDGTEKDYFSSSYSNSLGKGLRIATFEEKQILINRIKKTNRGFKYLYTQGIDIEPQYEVY